MPISPINFAQFQPQSSYIDKDIGLGNIFKNMMENYKSADIPSQLKRREEKETLSNEAEMFKNQMDKKYTEREREAGIGLKTAGAQRYENMNNVNSPKERRVLWNGLGSDGKAEMNRIGSVFGWTPQETQANYIDGVDFSKYAEENGIDLSNEQGNFLATSANRTKISDASAAASELDYLENAVSKDLSTYGETFHGYSPDQIADALKGNNKEKMIKFLGARALQPEIAQLRNRIAGGSDAYAAAKHAQESALANFKIPGFTITSEVREGVQKYINKALRGGLQARKKGLLGQEKKEDAEIAAEMLNGDLPNMSIEELHRLRESAQ